MKTLLIALATLAILTACGNPPAPHPHPTVTPTSATPRLSPLGFGTFRLGMTKEQAAATGLFDADVTMPSTYRCAPGATFRLLARAPFTDTLKVDFDASGRVDRVAAWGNVTTSTGLHAGSTYAEVKTAYPTLSAVSRTVYGESGVFVREGSDYLGFLLPVAPNAVQDDTRVERMELAHGARPALAWDGC